MSDRPDLNRVWHELVSSHAFANGTGCKDGNNLHVLHSDPAPMLAVGLNPESGDALALQSTISHLRKP